MSTQQKRTGSFLFPIRFQLLLCFLLVVIVVAGISIAFVSLFMQDFTYATQQKRLGEDAATLSKYLASQDRDAVSVVNAVSDNIVRNNNAILLLGSDGKLSQSRNTASLEARTEEKFPDFIRKTLEPYLAKDGASDVDFAGQVFPVYTQKVYSHAGRLLGYVVLVAPADDTRDRDVIISLYVISICFASTFAIAVSYLFSGVLTANIKRLKNRAKLLAQRKFDEEISVYSPDEIGELALSIEEMAQNIRQYDHNQKVFLQNASHELRTPLMSIRGYVEGMRDGVFTDTGEACDLLLGQVERLEKLVNEVLYLSKIETNEGAVRLRDVTAEEVFDEISLRAHGLFVSSAVRLTVGEVPDVTLFADADALATAVTNILTNALRYARTEVSLGALCADGRLTVTVRDDGNGFKDTDLPHLFDRFYKGAKGKFGLGLSISKAIAEAHGGTLNAHNVLSDDGIVCGAEFVLSVPVKQ